MKQCQGSCDEHIGNIVRVAVWGKSWGRIEFDYCEAAIEEDLRRGFNVAILTSREAEAEVSDTTKMPKEQNPD